ncbi:MAG: thioesterase, partial [Flavobacteriaceae bacterium]|nr:thioesterase [Flavobacteriaceae bacterium]
LSFMYENGFGQAEMSKNDLGPVVFYEHMYYFKEVFPGKPITVSLQLKGLSEDGRFFSFLHNFYDSNGINLARCVMMAGWIDLTTRKLRAIPEALLDSLQNLEKTKDFYTITKEDTRKHGQKPEHL